MSAPTRTTTVRHRIVVTGTVQGVGFRPFVHRLATAHGLTGHVGNDAAGVFVEVQGAPAEVERFTRGLVADAPPLAVVGAVTSSVVAPRGDEVGVTIMPSRAGSGAPAIPPDVATCDACLAELTDPGDRRHRHPFISCTHCGPRFTIVTGLPYDRPATTMAGFPMCDRCAAEYLDPADRRFHAQPIACPDCGPVLWFDGPRRRVHGTDAALLAAQRALAAGLVVAVKGLGGYHLACRADDEAAVRRVRERKARGDKPFAVLVRDLATARRYARITPDEATVLTSSIRPVVLLERRPCAPVARSVAPGHPWLGVMLPPTPLHHLLLAPVPRGDVLPPAAVVLTSANRSDEPICTTDEDVTVRLPFLTDAVLDHDRPIAVACDDSVVRVLDGAVLPLRRSRGLAPRPVDLGPVSRGTPRVLAAGAELKNTVCLTDGRRAWLSAHVGDMASLESRHALERAVDQLVELRGEPDRLAADRHPAYLTRAWAEERAGDRPVDLVQHHHAHVAALLAEHGRLGTPVVGVAYDGTGCGTDDTVWGGEILLVGPDASRFRRAAHLAAVPLAGGDLAVRQPWRGALAHLRAAGVPWDPDLPPVTAAGAVAVTALDAQLRSGSATVACTSMGRLLDAVASLLGVRHEISYEGQAAVELEVLATTAAEVPWPLALDVGPDGVMRPARLLRDLVAARRGGAPVARLAAGVHEAVAVATTVAVLRVAGDVGTVGLTGGVFQNVLLLRACRTRLAACGFEVLVHREVPPNDGGLALGQAAVAALRGRSARARGEG